MEPPPVPPSLDDTIEDNPDVPDVDGDDDDDEEEDEKIEPEKPILPPVDGRLQVVNSLSINYT